MPRVENERPFVIEGARWGRGRRRGVAVDAAVPPAGGRGRGRVEPAPLVPGALEVRMLARRLALLVVLVGCGLAPSAPDPHRATFVGACEGRTEYQSMKPDRRAAMCGCVYDRTLDGLSASEQQAARFYLFEQVGLDGRPMLPPGPPDLQAMGPASEAIGRAVLRCR